jgi:hypothetical protein
MHEGSRFQRGIGTFIAKIALGEPAKLSVDDGHQLIQRFAVPSAQITKDLSRSRLYQCFVRPAPPVDAHTSSFVEFLPSSHGRDPFGQSLAAKKQAEADEGAYERLDNVGLRRDSHDGRLVDWAKHTLLRRSKAKKRK